MLDELNDLDPTPTDYDTRPACAVPYVVVAALVCAVGVCVAVCVIVMVKKVIGR